MNKVKFVLFVAGISLALGFVFSCSDDDSGSSEQSYNYCITTNGCLTGPFTASTCTGQLSNSCPSSSSKAIVPSSSSKAAVQEYCVYRSQNNDFCGVIEPIGSPISCSVGTKKDNCPYGYSLIQLDLLYTCVKGCSSNFSGTCSRCGGSQRQNGTCTASSKYCGIR